MSSIEHLITVAEEYWIVDAENRSVVIYKLQGDELAELATHFEEDEIVSEVLPELHLKVGALFIF